MLGALERKTIQSQQQIGDMSVAGTESLRETFGVNITLLDFMEEMNQALPNHLNTDYAEAAAAYVVLRSQ